MMLKRFLLRSLGTDDQWFVLFQDLLNTNNGRLRPHCRRGSTLIEFIIASAIIGTLVTWLVGSWQSNTLNTHSSRIINALLSSVLTAHTHATSFYEREILLCPSSDGATCNTSDWAQGWIAVLDENSDGIASDSETVLNVSTAVRADFTVTALGFGDRLAFDSKGIPAQSGTFVVCDQRGAEHGKAIIINGSGQTRIATDDDGDGIVNSHLGRNVACT